MPNGDIQGGYTRMITFNILAHDGTLYPSWARYKGCTYFCDRCREITVEDVLEKVRNRFLYRLNKLSEGNLGSDIRVHEDCPTKRYNLIKKIRSASERANSTMKKDLKILEKPRVINAHRANILASSRYKFSMHRLRRFLKYLFPIPDFKYTSLCYASSSLRQASL